MPVSGREARRGRTPRLRACRTARSRIRSRMPLRGPISRACSRGRFPAGRAVGMVRPRGASVLRASEQGQPVRRCATAPSPIRWRHARCDRRIRRRRDQDLSRGGRSSGTPAYRSVESTDLASGSMDYAAEHSIYRGLSLQLRQMLRTALIALRRPRLRAIGIAAAGPLARPTTGWGTRPRTSRCST